MDEQVDYQRLDDPDQGQLELPGRTFDMATIIGLSGTFFMVIMAIVIGGTMFSFLDLRSFLIVFGGTFCATTTCFSIRDIINSNRIASSLLFKRDWDIQKISLFMLHLSDMARKKGFLSLENHLPDESRQPFLYKAMTLTIDGATPEEIQMIMEPELQSFAKATNTAVRVLKKSAEISPAMGLIGTLIGLIQMLGKLEDPQSIGPDMALALLTTLYGALLANIVFNPLATKMDRNASRERLVNEVYMTAMMSIARQEHPRRLEMLINSTLPPDKKIKKYD